MTIPLLIATSFSFGFFIESIVGFGGGLIAYAILGFFIDIKEMVLSGLYIGTLSSLQIFLSDRKNFDKKIYINSLPLALLGTIAGAFAFSTLPATILSLVLGAILLTLSIKIFFFDHLILPKFFKNKLIFLGGISQGAFGTGGPFWVNALKPNFHNKSALRSTMAMFFVSFNLIRILQLIIQKQLHFDFFLEIYWTIIPVFISIKLGHFFHHKLQDDLLKKSIALITFFAGIKFFTKALM